jgi:hypothetical protein
VIVISLSAAGFPDVAIIPDASSFSTRTED